MVVKYASKPSLYYKSDVPTLYVLPMEMHALKVVTSTGTMSYNVFVEGLGGNAITWNRTRRLRARNRTP
jgi:hypothetical protein